MPRMNRKSKLTAEQKNQFETARNLYLMAQAAFQIASEAETRYYTDHHLTDEQLIDLFSLGDVPPELEAILNTWTETFQTQSEARINLIDRAEEMSINLAKAYGQPFKDMPFLFEHMRKNPANSATIKALDAILRLDLR
jgi:hypothetical protein